MGVLNKDTKKLVKFMGDFQITDLLGFGQILGVEEKNQFEDYAQEILEKFEEIQDSERRKQLLRLAADLSKENKEEIRAKEKEGRGNQV